MKLTIKNLAIDDKIKKTPNTINRLITNALGSFRISATESEEKKREFRRSIVITHNMKKGDVLCIDDLDYKRPGGNLNPEMTLFVVGRTLNKDLTSDHILTTADLI